MKTIVGKKPPRNRMTTFENRCETVIFPLIVIQLNVKNRYIQKFYVLLQFVEISAKWNEIRSVFSMDSPIEISKQISFFKFKVCTRFFFLVFVAIFFQSNYLK